MIFRLHLKILGCICRGVFVRLRRKLCDEVGGGFRRGWNRDFRGCDRSLSRCQGDVASWLPLLALLMPRQKMLLRLRNFTSQNFLKIHIYENMFGGKGFDHPLKCLQDIQFFSLVSFVFFHPVKCESILFTHALARGLELVVRIPIGRELGLVREPFDGNYTIGLSE